MGRLWFVVFRLSFGRLFVFVLSLFEFKEKTVVVERQSARGNSMYNNTVAKKALQVWHIQAGSASWNARVVSTGF